MLNYFSTRGSKTYKQAHEAILSGLADDGGLYIPDSIPKPDLPLSRLVTLSYNEIAYEILKPFLNGYTEHSLKSAICSAYGLSNFPKGVAPLVKKSGFYFLELFHGPTLAFKDVALTLLPHLMCEAAAINNVNREIVILAATSGDTGKAALSGFKDVPGTKIIVFYPEQGVSNVQRMQMVTQEGVNTFVAGVKGNFDDAQTGVKHIFGDTSFASDIGERYVLSSANSINIGRLVPQIVYYFHAYSQLVSTGEIDVGEGVNFAVPTGNFGNILAAYYAKEMGLPVNKLICASNENNVLTEFFNTGVYNANRAFYATTSPSMDILISSNFERLLFYMLMPEHSMDTSKLMHNLSANGRYAVDKNNIPGLFTAGCADSNRSATAIKAVYEQCGYVMDTHTAVAYAVAADYAGATGDDTKTVIVSTASPFKFPGYVMPAIFGDSFSTYDEMVLIGKMGSMLNIEIPLQLIDLPSKPILHNSVRDKKDLKAFVSGILSI